METPTLCILGERAKSGSKKGAIVRRLKKIPVDGVVLFEDETILRMFPPLRNAWAMRGQQAIVPITGQNAKRVMFGAINPCTGRRTIMRRANAWQEDFQAFLQLLRRHYRVQPIWLLLDRAPDHTAGKSKEMAKELDMELIWLPKQCPELNAMDQLWKELKGDIAANRQFRNIDEAADYAQQWVLSLSPNEALRKAGVLSENYWLKHF